MAWIILGIVVGIVMALCAEKSICSGLAGAFVGLLVGVAVHVILGGVIGLFLPTTEVIQEQEICALGDGYLFVGDDMISYAVSTDNGKQIKTVGLYETYIREGDCRASVKIHCVEFKKSWYKLFARDIGIRGQYIEFYVPENTIKTEYNVDLP